MLSATMTPAGLRQFVGDTGAFIARQQLPSGAIPWYRDAVTDPWDHVECAVALDLSGRGEAAAAATPGVASGPTPDRRPTPGQAAKRFRQLVGIELAHAQLSSRDVR